MDINNNFNDFLDEYLEIYIKPNVSYRTYVRYKPAIELQIKPYFKNKDIYSINENDIYSFYKYLIDNSYSPYTVNTNAIILSGAFEILFREGLIKYNPTSLVKRPKIIIKQKTPISDELFNNLINEFNKDELYGDFFSFIAYSGLRRGEALGLSIDDVDFKNKSIFIHQQITLRSENKGSSITYNTKTNKSRLIYPEKEAFYYLRRQINLINKYKKESHSKEFNNKNNLIFVNKFGNCIFNPELLRHFKIIKNRVGLNDITIHSLRSICASRITENKNNIKKASKLLGHTKYLNTYEYYLTLTNKMMKDLADEIDKIYGEYFNDYK